MRKLYIAIFLAILFYGMFIRLVPFNSASWFQEPDNYIYFLIANQTLHTGTVPLLNNLSGFPTHNDFGESPGLIYLAVYPAKFFTLFGINLVWSMHLTILFFSLIGILLAYLFTLRITKKQELALFAMLFMATMPAAIFKGSYMEWRGESFVPIFLGVALFLEAEGFERKDMDGFFLMLIGLILFAIGLSVWNGAAYILPVAGAFIVLVTARYLNISLKIAGITMFLVLIAAFYFFELPILSHTTFQLGEAQPISPLFILADFYFCIPLALIGLWLLSSVDYKDMQSYTIALLSILMVTTLLAVTQVRWSILAALPIAVLSGIGLDIVLRIRGVLLAEMNVDAMIGVIIIGSLFLPLIQLHGLLPAESQTPDLFSALNYMAANTPRNATFLTLWDDGSFIEGYANRQSYTDSVSGFNGIRAIAFERFLLENQTNLTYIANVSPNYLFIRRYWIQLVPSFKTELNITSLNLNQTNYAIFLKQQNITEGNITLTVAYRNLNETIYKVEYAKTSRILNITEIGRPMFYPNTTIQVAYLQFIPQPRNATLGIAGNDISPVVLNPYQEAELPIGNYTLAPNMNGTLVIAGNAILKGYSLRLKGNAILYLNASAK